MITKTTHKHAGVVANYEKVGKVFIIVDLDTRRCLICEQLFTRQASREHSMTVCYPPASSAH
jgi:hypothetical protein